MKILAIGDFHGKFPKKFEKIIKDVDVVLCLGDFGDTTTLRNLEFKYWDDLKDESLENIIGKKKFKEILIKTTKSMDLPLKKLTSSGKKILTIYGNSDILDKELKKHELKGFETKCRKLKIKLLKTSKLKLGTFTLIGFSGYRGAMSKGLSKKNSKLREKIKKDNIKWKKRLDKIFSKVKEKKVIFLTHDVPRGYFDKVKNKNSPLFGKHVGDEYFTKYIKKYSPRLFICGHMHEYQGKIKLGKTTIVATGAAHDGKAVLIEIDKEKEPKIKFIK